MIGREAERALLASLVEGLPTGRPFVLTIRGEPGSGRSSVLEAGRDLAQASGARVLAARGIGHGDELPFSGLSSLLRPFGAALDALAADHTPVLRSALGLGDDAPAEPAGVRLGLLRALTTAAEAEPILLLLDDADRLDEATVASLAFVLGRLGVDPIGAIVTTGPGVGPLDGVTTQVLPLPALARAALAEIVVSAVPCTPAVADAVAAWADGSPLVAVELARSLTADERDGTAPLPHAPRPTVLVVDRLQKELEALPADVQRALVVAAADRTGLVGPIETALATLGEQPGALDRAEAAGLVVIDGPAVRFRHALLEPLAYRLVATASRRAAHRALAAALTEPRQAAERAWQLVSSCAGPDEDVAATLELVAESEQRTGTPATAAAAFEQAARLSTDPAARARRLVAASGAHLDAFELDAAHLAALDATAAGGPEAQQALVEAVERRDGPRAALGLDPLEPAVRADLQLALGQRDAAASTMRGAEAGPLVSALRAQLDDGAPLPPEPPARSPLGRRARRRWLQAAAERGIGPASPTTVDELLAAAVAVSTNGRAAEAAELAARAAGLVPSACAHLAEQAAAVVARVAERTGPVDALVAVLSAAELRVAEAVASGLTNRQAADHLFLSAKTVDFHLQSIYRKLAIRSRAELATKVATRGLPAIKEDA